MRGKEIRIFHDGETGKIFFYRMESGSWRLIDDSEDRLRSYKDVSFEPYIWNQWFFRALREAACAEEDEVLVVWFEGPDCEYNGLRECLNDCGMEELIRIEFIEPAQEEAPPDAEAETDKETDADPAFSQFDPLPELEKLQLDPKKLRINPEINALTNPVGWLVVKAVQKTVERIVKSKSEKDSQ